MLVGQSNQDSYLLASFLHCNLQRGREYGQARAPISLEGYTGTVGSIVQPCLTQLHCKL